MAEIEANGVPLTYDEEGSGPPIVMAWFGVVIGRLRGRFEDHRAPRRYPASREREEGRT